jgi:heme-degrading monooxygenase HmoA
MIVGQTMFSVLSGTEDQAETALQALAKHVAAAPGHVNHRILRSFGMSPLASDLHSEGREATLGSVHFIFETQWEALDDHDRFYASGEVRNVYADLQHILTRGPFEVLYDSVVEQPYNTDVAVQP